MNRNLVKNVIENGGSITPLLISPQHSNAQGLMNPSILIDNDKILLNLRNINYTLYHCEGQQLFTSRWGPLTYLHPENDMHLRTFNYMCELDKDTLSISSYSLTDTSQFDVEPLWDFVGLEDARLVRWDGKLYQCGVRRDTTPNGVGRMELSELYENADAKTPNDKRFKEISRVRIEAPIDKNSYCEKNWMPVLDLPYHFVKWSNPTEVVKVNPITGESEQVYVSNKMLKNIPDLRGGSQVIRYLNYRIALLHEVNLFNNKLNQKDGTYLHRFIVWDLNWNIVTVSEPFSFMDGEIEFSCGIAFYENSMLLTFGFQDNAAYILKVPGKMINELIGLLPNGNLTDEDVNKMILLKNFLESNLINIDKNDTLLSTSTDPAFFNMFKNISNKIVYTKLDEKNKHLLKFDNFFVNDCKKAKLVYSSSLLTNYNALILYDMTNKIIESLITILLRDKKYSITLIDKDNIYPITKDNLQKYNIEKKLIFVNIYE